MSVNIINLVDIKSESNKDFGMRITTDVKSGDTFYTDLNGFQVGTGIFKGTCDLSESPCRCCHANLVCS